jgi:hypothetical protein
MNFLKWLLGGGASTSNSGDGGYYLYVRPKMCREIVRVRVNLTNDASLNDDESGYILRKTASATRCPFQAEITLHLNKSRAVLDKEITNGEFVSEQNYLDWLDSQKKKEEEVEE